MVQNQYGTLVVFERTMVKTGLTAVIFPTIKGASKLLDSLVQNNRIGPINALIIEKNKHGQLKVKKSINQAETKPQCNELGLAVALLLRGSVASDLLGGAANTLLAQHIELGIDQEEIDSLMADMVAGSAVLFVQACSNLSLVALPQTRGIQYDFPLTAQIVQELKIMSATLDYYWLED
jgi:uncharacterized membrane protein